MECTVFNAQKGRMETLDVEFTAANTTDFTSQWLLSLRNPQSSMRHLTR